MKMYEMKIMRLKEMPVFSVADVSQIVSGKEYAKKLVRRLVEKGEIYKIENGRYSFYDDSFLISCFLVKPSYVTSVSALAYHKLISQIPNEVFCASAKKQKKINFKEKINFMKTKYFFGYNLEEYNGFKIPIADKEKAIIDSIGFVPISLIEEAISEIDIEKMSEYLIKIDKSSIIKRIGFLLEKKGYEVEELKNRINKKYILLDPLSSKRGIKNKKWGLIINYNAE